MSSSSTLTLDALGGGKKRTLPEPEPAPEPYPEPAAEPAAEPATADGEESEGSETRESSEDSSPEAEAEGEAESGEVPPEEAKPPAKKRKRPAAPKKKKKAPRGSDSDSEGPAGETTSDLFGSTPANYLRVARNAGLTQVPQGAVNPKVSILLAYESMCKRLDVGVAQMHQNNRRTLLPQDIEKLGPAAQLV
jgi:hypothetical protein